MNNIYKLKWTIAASAGLLAALGCAQGGHRKKPASPSLPQAVSPSVPPSPHSRPQAEARGLDRELGALMGLAVGDALGTTHEFLELHAPPFPTLATGPLVDIVGNGPFHLPPGTVTDDTQMAIMLARSLDSKQRLDPEDVGKRYQAWEPLAFDAGTLTRQSIRALARGLSPDVSGLEAWLQSGGKSAGNGSLMRTAPIGVFFAQDRTALVKASLAESAITHADPRCQLACAAFNAAIAAAVTFEGQGDLVQMMFRAAEKALTEGHAVILEGWAEPGITPQARAAWARHPQVPLTRAHARNAEQDLLEDLEWARKEDPNLYGNPLADSGALHLQHQQGFVRVAFRLAFWELAHAPSFQAALLDVVNRGGDADTNGAITGALLGARHGFKSIPGTWVRKVEAAGPFRRIPAELSPTFFRAFLGSGASSL